MRFLRAVCLTALLSSAAGCAALSTGQAGDPEFASEADANLRLGDEALERKDYLQAEKYFEHVRTKYPYLDVANEAELKLADLDFAQERYSEAREKYQSFIKLHPTHPRVDYAAYRAALSHFEDIPSDFFLVPPSTEKDQTEVRAALVALNDFVRQYPDSQYLGEAKQKLEQTREKLAEHEMYVARFYARRERWKAVAQRLESLLKNYPGTKLEEEALFDLHDAYVRLNDAERAKQTLQRVIERLPGTPAAERAQRMMGS
ncbi:outer membrane protein assembly factor BamD [Archangium violaceum]|uniref:outer membrane protein assembly factor BamD n=1 Tax=Archangium violaceum TaxID=83451 RepID=UPI001951EE8C|nr:outer membrane protein assembly factor BamD [Archangium violaceum]QRN94830.1 outer membrane protein assembly factor BamD [Archangium violaceum]